VFILKKIPDILMLGILSFFLLWGYDYFIRMEYFHAEDIEIIGIRKLSPKDLLKHAGLERGVNVLSVNLALVRSRLLSNPWIAEAEVERELPSDIRISVKEHDPLAVLDLGKKFILNTEGKIFKEWMPSDPQWMPVVTGLEFSDIRGTEESSTTYFAAVIDVLHLGAIPKSLMPNHSIKKIHIDHEMGLSVYPTERVREIKLGFGEYAAKYEKLKNILKYLEEKQNLSTIDSIDLHDASRIVVNPIRAESLAGDDKEV
jgi:cell division protein FtsQ